MAGGVKRLRGGKAPSQAARREDAMTDVRERPWAEPDHGAYAPLEEATAAARLAGLPGVAARLGGAPSGWQVREVGDGNLNLVFIVRGPEGSVCAKQALPYLRVVGEGWPLPLSRAFYEAAALARQAQDAGSVPEILHVEAEQALIVMEDLSSHRVWRGALIEGARHESAAPRLGRFMAEALFRSSDLALAPEVRKREAALFAGNAALCRISEDLIFTDPYTDHPLNDVTPGMEAEVAAMRADAAWRLAVQELKWDFTTRAEALLHGDLHTGSVMVSPAGPDEDVRVIDPEFAFYGPMGFDVGALIANLFLSGASKEGEGRAWSLAQAPRAWDAFAARFGELWRSERRGEAQAGRVLGDAAEAALAAMLSRIERDAIGFAGAKMARRIVGLAGVADLATIEPAAARVARERPALRLAGHLVREARSIGTIAAATSAARDVLDG